MSAIQVKFVEKKIAYTGEQLRSHWAYRSFDLLGDSAVAFVGPCDVRPEFMKDVEDLKAASRIYSEEMLHFIVEHFGCALDMAVLRQRLLMAIMAENLNRRDLRGGPCNAQRLRPLRRALQADGVHRERFAGQRADPRRHQHLQPQHPGADARAGRLRASSRARSPRKFSRHILRSATGCCGRGAKSDRATDGKWLQHPSSVVFHSDDALSKSCRAQ